jgi:hypothetical protein
LAWIFIGFTMLYLVTESISEALLIAAGTACVFTGTRAFVPKFLLVFFHEVGAVPAKNEDKNKGSQ